MRPVSTFFDIQLSNSRAFPIAEIFSVFMSAAFIRHVYKKEIAPLEN